MDGNKEPVAGSRIKKVKFRNVREVGGVLNRGDFRSCIKNKNKGNHKLVFNDAISRKQVSFLVQNMGYILSKPVAVREF